MLGKTKGTVISELTMRCPGKDLLYKRYAPGIATNTVTIVDTAACHKVNQITPSVFGSRSWASQSPEKPRSATFVTGQ
jgi:hypothetical protein